MFDVVAANNGWSTALIGITTVFAALIVVSAAVALYAAIFRRLDQRNLEIPTPAPKPVGTESAPVAPAAPSAPAPAPAPAFRADEAAVAIIAVALEARRERIGRRMADAARNARAAGAAWSTEGRLRALSNRPR